MLCDTFNKNLLPLLSGELSAELRDACEAHLADCAHCLDSFVKASEARFGRSDSDSLVRRVLQATVPDNCANVAAMLCAMCDGSLDTQQAAFLGLHLDDCHQCQQLADSLQWLRSELPVLAELQPPPALLHAVLRHTTHRTIPATNLALTLAARCRQLLLRPRFPLEAAFAATIVWTFLFGIPTSILDTAIAEQVAVIERLELPRLYSNTQSGIEREVSTWRPAISRRTQALENLPMQIVPNAVAFVQESSMALWHKLTIWIDALAADLGSRQWL